MLNTQVPAVVDEPDFGYGQLLSILLRRFVWFGGAIAIAVAAAIVLTLREKPVYQSSMQLLVAPNYQQTVDITGDQDNAPSLSQTDYATQLNLMRSDTFVAQAIEQLLEEYPELCREADTQSDCIDTFQSSLTLSQIIEDGTETRIFEAGFESADPAETKLFLDALGNVYLDYNEKEQEQRLQRGLALVNQQIDSIRGDLNVSRQALKQFRETENLINPEQQAIAVDSSLREVEQTKIDVDSQYFDVRAEYNALRDQLSADPEAALISSRLSQSSRYQQLLNELQEAELALEERLALYAEADPGVQDLRSQREGKIALLQEEVARVLGGTPSQINLSESDLLTEGQLSEIDLSLVADLVRAQVRLQSLAARQTGLDQAIQKLRAELNEFPNLIAEYNRLQPDVETQRQSLERLLALRQELSNELAQGGFSWDIVEAPKPGEKIGPQPKQNILLGAVAGLFVGGALAFCREAIDRVVRTSDELEKQTALPLLGVIPEMPGGKIRVLPAMPEVGHSPANVFPMSQWQPFRDAVDLIYKTIQLTNAQPLSSLMITSALAGEGKTILAVGLALSAARSHQRVLLVDANFRRPSLHKYFGLSNEHGLSTQLRPSVTQIDRIQVSPVPLSLPDTQIHVLPAGPVPEDPVRLLSSLQIRRFLKKAEAIYDLVIMDAPAILGLVDGLQLASLCKASIIVSRLDHITQDDLNNAISMLSKINTIGIVANGHQGGERAEKAYEHNGYSEVLSERQIEFGQGFQGILNWKSKRKRRLTLPSVGIGVVAVPALQGYVGAQTPRQMSTETYDQIPLESLSSAYNQLCGLATDSVGSAAVSINIPRWSNSS